MHVNEFPPYLFLEMFKGVKLSAGFPPRSNVVLSLVDDVYWFLQELYA